MRSLSRPARLLAILGVWACGAAAGEGSTTASETARRAWPEADENGVRVRSGEPNEYNNDGISACRETRRQVSTDEARALALPIDTHLTWFAQTHESSLHYGPPSFGSDAEPSSDTQIAIQIRPLKTYVVSVEAATRSDNPCRTDLAYLAVVTVETADGALAGAFYAPVRGSGEGLAFSGRPDMRNFEGTLEFPVSADRVHHAELWIAADLDAGEITGILQPDVTYFDVEPWTGARGGFAFFPARSGAGDPYCAASSAFEPATGPEWSTLDTYPGSDPPPTFPLRLEARVADGTSADVEVIVGGEARQLVGVSEREEIDLGSVEYGTELAVSVRNRAGGGRVSAVLFSDECIIAVAGCSGLECDDDAVVFSLDYCM